MCVLGMPTAALADEIHNGKIKVLFSLGGNPAAAIPGQNSIVDALEKLELFIQMDIKMSASAKMAHYVIPAAGIRRTGDHVLCGRNAGSN